MDLLSLNSDVFECIVSFLYRTAALHFAETCRVAHAVAMPQVLREVHLGSRSYDRPSVPLQITKFCDYLAAGAPERTHSVQFLVIHAYEFDANAACNLAAVVSQAARLRNLRIEQVERLLELCPAFADAVSSLDGLQSISLRGVGVKACSMLKEMKSRPHAVTLTDIIKRPHGSAKYRLLDHVADSLEVLHLESSRWHLDTFMDMKHSIWPSVHTLKLCGSVNANDLARAFPSLRNLTLCYGTLLFRRPDAQVWMNLDHVVMDRLQKSPFPCPIRRLSLKCDVTPMISGDVLRQASPAVLACELEQNPYCSDVLDQLAPALPNLKFLELTITDCSRGPLRSDTGPILKAPFQPSVLGKTVSSSYRDALRMRLKKALGGLSLVGIALCFRAIDCPPSDSLLMADLATTVASCIPTLAHVAISFERDSMVWYRVTSGRGGELPEVESLTELEGEDVKRRLLEMGSS